MEEWFKRSFGSDYMIAYRHRDWKQAEREVRRMAGWLALPAGSDVLDIGCGMGRHALALATLGYRVTGIDLSEELLRQACAANSDGRIAALVQGDMRRLPFEDGRFQATVNLFTSFGYFEEEADNTRVLSEIRRVLRKEDGKFLIDFLNPAYVIRHLVPRSERFDKESGLRIVETRRIEDGRVVKQIDICHAETGEDARRYEERVRLYPLEWFRRALAETGLAIDQTFGDYEGNPYDESSSPRMILVGRTAG